MPTRGKRKEIILSVRISEDVYEQLRTTVFGGVTRYRSLSGFIRDAIAEKLEGYDPALYDLFARKERHLKRIAGMLSRMRGNNSAVTTRMLKKLIRTLDRINWQISTILEDFRNQTYR